MVLKLVNKLHDFFRKGHVRTLKAKKNITISFLFKGLSILINLLLVPLVIHYLNPTKYGIWLTLSSIISWFSFFDIGLGNGLRNKLTESLAKNDIRMARTYVSTTYVILTTIIIASYLVFLFLNKYIDWSDVLNADPEMGNELSWIAFVVFTFFCMRFVFKLIGIIFIAYQEPSVNNIFDFLGNFIALITIFIISKTSEANLLYISIAYSAPPVAVLIFSSFFFFKHRFKSIRPGFRYVKFKYSNDLIGMGIKFFVLQLAVLIIFSTDNMIITQVLGPSYVSDYNIAFKYFGIPLMAFTIILTPYWSAYTDAIANKDIVWIRKSIDNQIKIWLLAIVGIGIMLVVSDYIYKYWIGDIIQIPFVLSVFMALYTIQNIWNSIFVSFLNGSGIIRIQIYYSVVAMIINIPISILFAREFGLGSSGVILGTCVSMGLGSILAPIQTKQILNSKAKGVWLK